MTTEVFLFALGLTVFAGLSTGIGSIMSFFSKSFNPKFLSAALGFSVRYLLRRRIPLRSLLGKK